MDMRTEQQQYNPYRVFSRTQWAKLRDDMPMTLQANEIERSAAISFACSVIGISSRNFAHWARENTR